MTTEYADRNVHPTVAEQYFRNGRPAHAKQIRSLMRAINTIQARSRVIVPPMVWPLVTNITGTYGDDGCIARAVYPSSINGTRLGVRFVIYPSWDDTKDPSWYMKIDGVNATPTGKSSHLFHHHCYKGNDWADATRYDVFVVDAEYIVSPAAIHEVELWRTDETAFLSWSIYEVEDPYLSGAEEFINTAKIAAGLPITDTNHETAVTLIRSIYDLQQGVPMNVNIASGITPATITDEESDLLKSVGGWGYNSVSYRFAPVGILPRSTTTYLYKAWVYGKRASGGGDVTCTFELQNGGAEVINIVIDSDSEDYCYSDYVPIQETVGEAHEIGVTAQCEGGTTGSIWAFGLMKLSYSTAP